MSTMGQKWAMVDILGSFSVLILNERKGSALEEEYIPWKL